ncbi:hypothetical protein GCM10009117_02790 [Gangjinia marincola]|uniref:histidine kinase n=1 Tax=Gangjinia marincola TaxID=578463 RepID=A0ABN1MDN1_9FLAO
MKKYRVILLLFILVVGCTPVLGQKTIFSNFAESPAKIDQGLYRALKDTKAPSQRIILLDSVAEIYATYSNPDSLRTYAQEIIKTAPLTSKTTYYSSIGAYYLGKANLIHGLLDEAIGQHITGIEMLQGNANEELLTLHQIEIATIYIDQKKLGKAKKILLAINNKTKSSSVKNLLEVTKGDLAFAEGDLPRAKSHYTSALELSSPDKKVNWHAKFGLVRVIKDEISLDDQFNKLALIKDEVLKRNYFDLYTSVVLSMADITEAMDSPEVTAMIYSTAYSNAISWNRLQVQKEIIDATRRFYERQGDFENAYALMTHLKSVSNQILTQQNSALLKDVEVKYETKQKEQEIRQLLVQQENTSLELKQKAQENIRLGLQKELENERSRNTILALENNQRRKENEILALQEKELKQKSEIERQKTTKFFLLIGALVVLIPFIALLIVYYQKLNTQIALNKSQEEVNEQKLNNVLQDQELKTIKASVAGQRKERERIAQELHDSIGGNLATIKLQLTGDGYETKDLLSQIDQTYHQVRDMSHSLIPKNFDENSFISLIENYLDQYRKNTSKAINFSPHPKVGIEQISKAKKVELFKILQELMTNALKHSKASQIDIYLNKYKDSVNLLFEDNGNGFVQTTESSGFGLRSIQRRIEKLLGEINIDTALNRGTIINIIIPI